jgi:O6-methylguanine-DNA--protein-cysteine methyltransferase
LLGGGEDRSKCASLILLTPGNTGSFGPVNGSRRRWAYLHRYGCIWIDTRGAPETDASIPYFWELAGNMIDKSVFDHPKFYSGQAVDEGASPPIYMTFAQVTDVKQAIQDNLTGTPLSAKIATWTTKQVQLWSEIINGRETYQVSSYALRINRTFSSLYENTVSTANVGKLYTYAQIQAEASTVASPISNAVNANVPASGYWLKQAPVLSELSNRKLQMNQEWWWSDSYSQVLYDLKS